MLYAGYLKKCKHKYLKVNFCTYSEVRYNNLRNNSE